MEMFPSGILVPPASQSNKPLALVVLLENVGHIQGMNLPYWAMNTVDFVSEEYAKVLLRLYGAYRRYDRVVILEDQLATGPKFAETILAQSRTHRVDLLLLVHGHEGCLVGYRGQEMVGPETFERLRHIYSQDPDALDLRMVYGLNCFGASLASTWIDLGAKVVNGAVGVNWFPEPSLSVFLRNWLGGRPYSRAVQQSSRRANQVWYRLLRSNPQKAHPWILSSRQIIYGHGDITVNG